MTALACPRPVGQPATARLALLTLLVALAAITPRRARASEGETATDFKRVLFADIAWRPALVPLRNDVMPGMRTHLMLGARLSPTFTLGTMAHVTPYFGQIHKDSDKNPKVGAGLDVMVQVHVVRGFYLRAGVGAISHVPVAREITARTPGYGGQVGLGYAFKLGKEKGKGSGAALALGADYDLRILADKRRRGILVVGLSFMFG